MDYNKAFHEQQNKLLNDQSIGPGLYQLDESLKTKKPVYPWAAGTNVSQENQNTFDLTDIQSDLQNLGRPLTKNIFADYTPMESKVESKSIYTEDGFFNQAYTRLDNPTFDLREFGINRWQWLPIDPQKNAIEPFRRLGENTVQQVLDAHVTTCV